MKKLPRVLFDGVRTYEKIQDDPILHCGYHPISGEGRCNKPTTLIMALGEDRGGSWFPICDSCRREATEHQGWGFTFHVRYQEP